jgi:regulator of RNase E activity RraA
MNNIDKLILLCKERGASSTVVADALNKTGLIPSLYPINKSLYQVGRIKCVFASNGSNYSLHSEITNISPGSVIVVFTYNCDGRALLGELVVKHLIEKCGAAAVVVHGAVRDVEAIIANNYPVWCNGSTPIGCINEFSGNFPEEIKKDLYEKYEGAIAVCDASGVVAIPKEIKDDDVYKNIELTLDLEEVWFYCLNELGLNTFQIICKKEYLNLYDSLPKDIQNKIDRIAKK